MQKSYTILNMIKALCFNKSNTICALIYRKFFKIQCIKPVASKKSLYYFYR